MFSRLDDNVEQWLIRVIAPDSFAVGCDTHNATFLHLNHFSINLHLPFALNEDIHFFILLMLMINRHTRSVCHRVNGYFAAGKAKHIFKEKLAGNFP